jgi:glycosyltransferase involved in cell wall biosynthesis
MFFIEIQRYPSRFFDYILIKSLFWLFKKSMFQYAKYIFGWTKDACEFAIKEFPLENTSKVKLISAGIDTKQFYKLKMPLKKQNSSVLQILMASRFESYKRYQDIFKALKIMNASKKVIELKILAMRGSFKKEVFNMIKTMQIEPYVEFLKPVPYNEMNKIYSSNFDALVLPSYNEAIGMVVPEAMACGLPAIVSDTSGSKTYIEPGVNGLIFKTFDVCDLIKKLKLLENKRLQRKLSINSKKTIEENYSIDVISKKLYELIKK